MKPDYIDENYNSGGRRKSREGILNRKPSGNARRRFRTPWTMSPFHDWSTVLLRAPTKVRGQKIEHVVANQVETR